MFHIKDEKCDNDFTSWPPLDMQNTAISNHFAIVIREVWGRELPSSQQESLCAVAATMDFWKKEMKRAKVSHWGGDKMAAIFQKKISKAFPSMEKKLNFINNSLKFNPKGPIDNIPALVHIMAWRRPGDKPLSESIMVWWSTDAYIHHSTLMN